MQAAEENELPCLEMLLARGADVAAEDDQGNNALHALAGQKEKVGSVLPQCCVQVVDVRAPFAG